MLIWMVVLSKRAGRKFPYNLSCNIIVTLVKLDGCKYNLEIEFIVYKSLIVKKFFQKKKCKKVLEKTANNHIH